MVIKQLDLINFCGVKELHLQLDGKSANIYGANGTGKSTIANAFAWLLTDKPYEQVKDYTPAVRGGDGDDVHHINNIVSATVELDNGSVVTLKKQYSEVYKCKRGNSEQQFNGHTTDYYINDVPTKQKDYALWVCNNIVDTYKLQLLLNPLYFAAGIDDNARRQTILSLLDDISDAEIIDSNILLAPLSDMLLIPGSDERYSVSDFAKIVSSRKTELNKELATMPARIDEATRALNSNIDGSDYTGRDLARLKADKIRCEKEINSLQQPNAEITRIRLEISGVDEEYARQKQEYIQRYNDKFAVDDCRTAELRQELRKAKMDASLIEDNLSAAMEELRGATTKREQFTEQYNRIRAAVWDASQEICGLCGQRLPQDNIDKLKSDYNRRKSDEIERIRARCAAEASKDIIAVLQQQVQDLLQQQADADAHVKDLEQQVADAPEHIIPDFDSTDTAAELAARKSALQRTIDGDTADLATEKKIAELQALLTDINDDIAACNKSIAAAELRKTQQARVQELKEQECAIAVQHEQAQRAAWLCEEFARTKCSKVEDTINSLFDTVRFRLFETQVNGGIKEVCKVMVPSADGALVPFDKTNNAARVNAGLDVIRTLSRRWGAAVPVFVDNAESVTEISDIGNQTIRLIVSAEDKELRVEVDLNA